MNVKFDSISNNFNDTYQYYFKDFYNSLVKLGKNYIYSEYRGLLINFKNDIYENIKFNRIHIDHEKIELYLVKTINYILNFDDVFLIESNKSYEMSYDFLISVFEIELLIDKDLVISILYQLAKKSKFLIKEDLKRINSLLDKFLKDEPFIPIIKNQFNEKSKNLSIFDYFDIYDKESYIKTKKELRLANTIEDTQLYENFDDFRKNIVDILKSNENTLIFNDYIKQYLECNNFKLSNFSNITSLNLRLLYIIKKTLDLIDNDIKINPHLQTLFLNIISRSKVFISYLIKNVDICNNYMYFKNKEIFLNEFTSIGYFLQENILDYNILEFENYNKYGKNIIKSLIGKISKWFDENKLNNLNFKDVVYYFEESDTNNQPFSYLICYPLDNYNWNTISMNINIYNLDKYDDCIFSLIQYLKNINNLIIKKYNLDLVIIEVFHDKIINKFKPINIIITFNQPSIFRFNILYKLIKDNEVVKKLFIVLKIWMLKRNLIERVKNFYDIDGKKELPFDDNSLIILIIHFLINSNYLPSLKYESDITKLEIKYKKKFETINKIYKTKILVPFVYKKNCPTTLGKLFVNFFYFITHINEYLKNNPDKTYIINIKSEVSWDKLDKNIYGNIKLIIADFLESNDKNGEYKPDIIEKIDDSSFNDITNESYRSINYLLEEIPNTNLRFVKLFHQK